MVAPPYICLPLTEIPEEPGWLDRQPTPVLAFGEGTCQNADVVVSTDSALDPLRSTIEKSPIASALLVQVLRIVEKLSVEDGMTIESLAYATLQSGSEHQAWLNSRAEPAQQVEIGQGEPVILSREKNIVHAELNRSDSRNSLTIEMRDALIELFDLVVIDKSIECLRLSGRGRCFSVGGELREFGLAIDPAVAHNIRSMHNPSRSLARCADRVSCHLHGACIGSGIELPAFAAHVSAVPKTFFQLPELSFGLIPGAGGCVSISRRIGRQRTAWLVLSGKKINAQLALDWGLIDELVENSD